MLAAWHVFLFVVTYSLGQGLATDGNPLFCVELPVSVPLVGRDDFVTVLLVGVAATGWWYFIGQVGRASWVGKISRTMSLAGALLLLSIQTIAWFAMISEGRLIRQEANFGAKDIVIYVLAGVLLLGGLVSAGYSMVSVFRRQSN